MYLPPCGHVECLAKCPCVKSDPVVDIQRLLAVMEKQGAEIKALQARIRAIAAFVDTFAQEP